MFGRLNFEALVHDPITMGGIVGAALAILAIIFFLTYFKKWTWLYKEWLTSLDPKKIGVMYILAATVMLLRGLADAVMMRVQQATSVGSHQGIVSADTFQQVFSAHGTIMIFFVAMGFMFGILNLIVPLQIGARDVAFPFMNSASFWLYIAGALLVNLSLAVGEFSAAGWLAYPPLSELAYSPGVGVDYWIWSLQIAGIGSLLSGVNFLVTIIKMRAPGMTMMKMPIFVWSVLGAMSLVAFAFPILTATLGMLGLDRLMGMHFFTSTLGGNPMMYVNLIWAWGHPEVYILILPAFGIFSELVATFSGKRLFGYKSMVIALMSITILSFLVWLHHFFTMGAGVDVNTFFGIMTMIIAVPTGVKVFNWLFTMYRGRIRFTTPMLWFLGFVTTFTIGGMTGVLMSLAGCRFSGPQQPLSGGTLPQCDHRWRAVRLLCWPVLLVPEDHRLPAQRKTRQDCLLVLANRLLAGLPAALRPRYDGCDSAAGSLRCFTGLAVAVHHRCRRRSRHLRRCCLPGPATCRQRLAAQITPRPNR